MNEYAIATQILVDGKTGLSGTAIITVMLGLDASRVSFYDFPHDAGDFERCLVVLDAIPAWRDRMEEMAVLGVQWGRIGEQWADLEEQYHQLSSKEFYELITKTAHDLDEMPRGGIVCNRNGIVLIGEVIHDNH